MNSLAGILRQNEIDATHKSAARARAMNSNESHPKKACKRTTLKDRLKGTSVGASRGLDKLR